MIFTRAPWALLFMLVVPGAGCTPDSEDPRFSSGGLGGTGGDTGPGPIAGAASGAPGNIDSSSGTVSDPGSSDDCGSVEIDATVEEVFTGNLLLVFDQSVSMGYDWNGQPRWQAASDAVVAAITPVQDQLDRVGAIFFPSEGSLAALIASPTCDLALVCAIDDATCPNPQIPFMAPSTFLDAWGAHWARDPLRLSTPMEAAFQRGVEALQTTALRGKTVVLFVTDGGPWPDNPGPTCGTMEGTRALVASIASQGSPVHVVGVPGSQVHGAWLSAIAEAGGTGQYIDVAQPTELEMAVREVASTVIERRLDDCSIVFDAPPEDPDKVFLVVTEATSQSEFQVPREAGNWSLGANGTSVILEGATCTDALAGRFSSVRFEFGCVELPILGPS